MNTLIQNLVAAISLTLVVSCKILPPEDMPLPPVEWRMISGKHDGVKDCHEIGGLFSAFATAIEFSKGAWEFSENSEYAYSWLFIGYADVRDFPSQRIEKSDSLGASVQGQEWFAIDFSVPGRFVFQFPIKPENIVKTWKWSGNGINFSCALGRVILPIAVNISGSEGPDVNHQTQTSIGLSHDGSLLVYQALSLAKPSLLTRGLPKFFVYKFERINPGEDSDATKN